MISAYVAPISTATSYSALALVVSKIKGGTTGNPNDHI